MTNARQLLAVGVDGNTQALCLSHLSIAVHLHHTFSTILRHWVPLPDPGAPAIITFTAVHAALLACIRDVHHISGYFTSSRGSFGHILGSCIHRISVCRRATPSTTC